LGGNTLIFSDIVNVFIGMALTFATMSVIVSAATETLSSALKWRSATLLQGLKDLLNDPQLTGLAGDILNHAAVNPRTPGTSKGNSAGPAILPSYIPPLQFASALIDVIQHPSSTAAPGQLPTVPGAAEPVDGAAGAPADASLEAAIDKIPDAQIRTMLQGTYSRVNGNLESFRQEIANWFDASMDRVSGVYKRKSQLVSFLVALAISAAMNVSAFHIAYVVWAHPEISASLNSLITPTTTADNAIKALKQSDFPFGWNLNLNVEMDQLATNPVPTIADGTAQVLGWIVTAIATLFGAPFWFDTLQKFVQLGGTGPKPGAKKPST
jgi:hypothetical protein